MIATRRRFLYSLSHIHSTAPKAVFPLSEWSKESPCEPHRFPCSSSLLCVSSVAARAGPQVVPASGTVKFEDGSLLEGEILQINFSPAPNQEEQVVVATSDIDPTDGSFVLKTGSPPREGATEGDYRVVINAISEYATNRRDIVADEYADANKTPLTVTVERGEDNVFDLVVQPHPRKR